MTVSGNWRDSGTHQAWCRGCIPQDPHLRGAALIRWWFEAHQPERRQGAWRTVQIARLLVQVPLAVIHAALVEARAEGLVELTTEGWRWIG